MFKKRPEYLVVFICRRGPQYVTVFRVVSLSKNGGIRNIKTRNNCTIAFNNLMFRRDFKVYSYLMRYIVESINVKVYF